MKIMHVVNKMPIDDALEDMKRKDEFTTASPRARAPRKINAAELDSIMKKYILSLTLYAKKRSLKNFDIDTIELYTPWIRFKEGCNSVIGPVPRKYAFEILKAKDQELADFLEKFEKHFPTSMLVTEKESYEKLPKWIDIGELQDMLGYKDIVSFEKLGATLIIPDLNYLSLFIEKGQILRDYLAEIKYVGKKKNILLMYGNHFELNCEELDITHVKDKATRQVIYRINNIQEELVEAQAKSIIPAVRHALYCNVQTHTPELVIPEPDDKKDPALFPQKTTSIDDGDD